MRKTTVLIILILTMMLAACGGSDDENTPEPEPTAQQPLEAQPDTGGGAAATREVPTAVFDDTAGYPAPPTVAAVDPAGNPAGYPAPVQVEPTLDPYPGGRAIMLKPMGEQCADAPNFESAEEAVAELEDSGIVVFDYGEESLMVCAACGCPTSEHVRVEIEPGDVNSAMALGWVRE